jgi:hypothetical protein
MDEEYFEEKIREVGRLSYNDGKEPEDEDIILLRIFKQIAQDAAAEQRGECRVFCGRKSSWLKDCGCCSERITTFPMEVKDGE